MRVATNARGFTLLRYRNGKDVLPPELLDEVQKYLCGELLYIPKKEAAKASWGELSGSKNVVHKRNVRIAAQYRSGTSVAELIHEFCLSEASIRKIIYSYK